MANFLTDGRKALLAALKTDPGIGPLVKTWRQFGPGLRERLVTEPTYCTILALYPASATDEQPYNMAGRIEQDLLLRVITADQDAEPGEALAALVIDRIVACRRTLFGLAGDGLKNIRITSMRWDAYQTSEDALLLWDISIQVRLTWIRTL